MRRKAGGAGNGPLTAPPPSFLTARSPSKWGVGLPAWDRRDKAGLDSTALQSSGRAGSAQ